jgi:DNA-binding protein H-NS
VVIEHSRPGTRTARGREKTKAALAAGAPKGCKYFNASTGETWSGRGLMPKWLKVATSDGKPITDFEVRA